MVLIIQPLPGIGDMVWHIPSIHCIARKSKSKVALLAKPRSMAKELFKCDPYVNEVIDLLRRPGKHDGIIGFIRLCAEFRKFKECWILHNGKHNITSRYNLAAMFAGISKKYGYGINHDKISGFQKMHPINRANAFLSLYDMNPSFNEKLIFVCEKDKSYVNSLFSQCKKPWVIFGIGSSEEYKRWPTDYFIELSNKINIGTIFLCGGKNEILIAEEIKNNSIRETISVCDFSLSETIALISMSRLYVGNDTGVMNISAALNIPTIGLFGLIGLSEPLNYKENLHSIAGHGMKPIKVDEVFKKITSVLDT